MLTRCTRYLYQRDPAQTTGHSVGNVTLVRSKIRIFLRCYNQDAIKCLHIWRLRDSLVVFCPIILQYRAG